jgi:hypothetical protein
LYNGQVLAHIKQYITFFRVFQAHSKKNTISELKLQVSKRGFLGGMLAAASNKKSKGLRK